MLLTIGIVVGLTLVALGIAAAIWEADPLFAALAEVESQRLAIVPEPPEPAPFPLIVPRGAGWGTLLDLSMTTVFRPSWIGDAIVPDRIIDVT